MPHRHQIKYHHITRSELRSAFHHSTHIEMLHGPIAMNLVKMAIPILVSAVLQQLFNSADMIVVGRFAGENSLAAVGANSFIINLMINLFVGLSVGSNVVIARLIGSRDYQAIHRAVHTSLALAIISGFSLVLIGWFVAEPVLRWMDTPAEIMPEAVTYFRISFLGMPFLMLFNFASAILRSKGDTSRPLYVLTVCGVLNIILNLFFVVNCKMSVAGVAWATLISTALSSFTLLHLLCHETDYLHVHLREILTIDPSSLRQIASVGIPAGIQGAIFSFSNVMIQSGVNSFGPSAIAANTAALNFDFFSYFTVSAFSQAGMSFISQNLGAGQHDRCRRVIRDTILLGVGSTACVSWLFILLRDGLATLFCNEPEVIVLAARRIAVVLCLYFVHSLNDILSSLMRGVGYSLMPALICIIGICGTRLLWLYYIFPLNPTFDMLNCCYPVSWLVTSCVMIPVSIHILRKSLTKN